MARATATRNHKVQWYHPLPNWAWGIVAIGAAIGLVSPEPLLSLAAWAVLPMLVHLTWRVGEPPIALIGVLNLWIVSAGPVIYFSGFKWLALEDVAGTYPSRFSTDKLAMASWLSLLATLVVAVGIRFALRNVPPISRRRIKQEALRLSPRKLFIAYLALYALNTLFGGGRLLGLGGLAQAAIALSLIRWGVFFLLAVVVLFKQQHYGLLLLAIVVEVGLGLLGFWGSFKDFFFIFAIAFLTARPNVSFRQVQALLAVFLVVFFVGLFWQTIKSDYRGFLRENPRVTFTQEVQKMGELAASTRAEDLSNAMDHTVERITVATFFFGLVLEYIPEYRPHDGGEGWKRGIEHVTKPRLFFPDKPALHASEITNEYVAATFAGADQGASFAIGYFGESYADLGYVWMYGPILLVGLMLGYMLRFFIVSPYRAVMGFAFAVAFLPARIGEIKDIPSLLGWSITHFVVMSFALYFAGDKLYTWLRAEETRDRRRNRPLAK
jgi:hypothetical protein